MSVMFGIYIASVFETMEGKMSGICSLVLTVAATYSTFFSGSQGIEHAKFYLWAAAALTFLFANYTAWKREHKKVVSGKPEIKIWAEQVNWELDANNDTVLVFAVYMLNSGAPSITRAWHGSLKIGNGADEKLQVFHLSGEWILARDGQSVTLSSADTIISKTLEKRLETGEGKAGRIFYKIEGDRIDQLKSANFKATIGCLDFQGNLVNTIFTPQGAPLVGVQLYPGEKGGVAAKLPESASHTPLHPPEEGG